MPISESGDRRKTSYTRLTSTNGNTFFYLFSVAVLAEGLGQAFVIPDLTVHEKPCVKPREQDGYLESTRAKRELPDVDAGTDNKTTVKSELRNRSKGDLLRGLLEDPLPDLETDYGTVRLLEPMNKASDVRRVPRISKQAHRTWWAGLDTESRKLRVRGLNFLLSLVSPNLIHLARSSVQDPAIIYSRYCSRYHLDMVASSSILWERFHALNISNYSNVGEYVGAAEGIANSIVSAGDTCNESQVKAKLLSGLKKDPRFDLIRLTLKRSAATSSLSDITSALLDYEREDLRDARMCERVDRVSDSTRNNGQGRQERGNAGRPSRDRPRGGARGVPSRSGCWICDSSEHKCRDCPLLAKSREYAAKSLRESQGQFPGISGGNSRVSSRRVSSTHSRDSPDIKHDNGSRTTERVDLLWMVNDTPRLHAEECGKLVHPIPGSSMLSPEEFRCIDDRVFEDLMRSNISPFDAGPFSDTFFCTNSYLGRIDKDFRWRHRNSKALGIRFARLPSEAVQPWHSGVLELDTERVHQAHRPFLAKFFLDNGADVNLTDPCSVPELPTDLPPPKAYNPSDPYVPVRRGSPCGVSLPARIQDADPAHSWGSWLSPPAC